MLKLRAKINGETRLLFLNPEVIISTDGENYIEILYESSEGVETLGYVKANNLVSLINVETLRCSHRHKMDLSSSTKMDFKKFPLKIIDSDIEDSQHLLVKRNRIA